MGDSIDTCINEMRIIRKLSANSTKLNATITVLRLDGNSKMQKFEFHSVVYRNTRISMTNYATVVFIIVRVI